MTYTEAESALIEAVRLGVEAKFDGDIIGAELIRALMLGVTLADGEPPVPAPCGIRVNGAVIDGHINLNNGRGEGGTVMPGLVLDNCVIGGGLDISYAQLGKLSIEKSAISELRAVRAVIEGEMIANDIHPVDNDGYCFLSWHSIHVNGDIQIRRARLRETPELDIHGTKQYALDLRNSTINGNVYLRYIDCLGTINLSLAIIEGNLTMRCGRILPSSVSEFAIFADGIIVKGALALRGPSDEKPFIAYGPVSLLRTKLGAGVFDGAQILPQGPCEFAFDMTDSEVGGSLYFRDKFTLEGRLKLRSVTVRLDILAENARIARGVEAVAVHIGGELNLIAVDTDDAEIKLEDATVGIIIKTRRLRAHLDLKRARTKTLDDGGSYNEKYRVFLDGFQYERLEHPGPRDNEKRRKPQSVYDYRMRWLASQGEGYTYYNYPWSAGIERLTGAPRIAVTQFMYRPQPLLQLNRVMNTMGIDEAGRKILRAKQWIETRQQSLPPGTVLRLFGVLFGFGYSSTRAVFSLAAYLLIGWSLFLYASYRGELVIQPQPVATYVEGSSQPLMPDILRAGREEIPCDNIDAAYYALDLMVPLIDLHTEQKCDITDREFARTIYVPFSRIDPMLSAVNSLTERANFSIPTLNDWQLPWSWQGHSYWKLVHTIYAMTGWLIVSLAILTFSGLLRQKERIP